MKHIKMIAFVLLTCLTAFQSENMVDKRESEQNFSCFSKVNNSYLDTSGDQIFLNFNLHKKNYSFGLNFDYYAYNNGLSNYYLGDCLKDYRRYDMDIVHVKIGDDYFGNSQEKLLEVYFHKDNHDGLFVIENKITNSQINLLSIYNNCPEEVESRLNQGISILSKFREEKNDLEEINVNSDLELSSTIVESADDIMARNDEYLQSHSLSVNASETPSTSAGILEDDGIVNMGVNKNWFLNAGKYSYIGQNYGFFLTTTIEATGSFYSEILYFTIEVKTPGMKDPVATASAKIMPKIQRTYESFDSTYPKWKDLNVKTGLTSVVLPLAETKDHYLKNIRFSFSIANKTALNRGQAGYTPSNDYGDYIYQSYYTFNGEGKTTGRNSYLLDNVQFRLGDNSLNVGTSSAAVDLFENASGSFYLQNTNSVSNKQAISTFSTNTIDQINNYGGLIKTIVINPVNQETSNPLLIGNRTENNYAEATIKLASKSMDSAYSEEAKFYIGFGLDYVLDDTYYTIFDWFPSGSIKLLSTSEKRIHYGDYQIVKLSLSHYKTYNANIDRPGKSLYYKFISPETVRYDIQANGQSSIIEIYDSNGQNKTSASGYDAKLSRHLEKNATYYIKINLSNSNSTGTFTFKITYGSSGTMYLNTYMRVEMNKECDVVYYTPTSTRQYLIQTIGNVDTVFDVYDENHTLLSHADDWQETNGNWNINAKSTLTLTASKTYAIKVYIYMFANAYGAGTTNLLISYA